MRTRNLKTAFLALAVASLGLGGCAYKSFYRQTDFKTQTQPTTPDQVRVVKSKDNLSREWAELGNYRGRAPTLKEAMETAKKTCAEQGANLYVLYVEAYQSSSGWNVDGACGYAESLGKKKNKKKNKGNGKPL